MDGRLMLTGMLEALSWVCLIGGVAFALIGAVGMLRFPDVFSRMHAAGIVDTLAAGLVLLGLGLQAPSWLVAVKLFLIYVIILYTGPTATHALARAALKGGVKPMLAGSDSGPQGESPSRV
jgi:multicomponent Na+:H+ antiporter subunit G